MAITPVTPSEGDVFAGEVNGLHADPLTLGRRLADAEQIAAERLDGAAAGSLKDALAVAPAPPDGTSSLVARVEAVRHEASPASDPAPQPLQPMAGAHVNTGATAPSPPPDAAPQVADALDVASRLAADATAAAEALDNLKRMLEQPVSIPGPAPLPDLMPEPGPPEADPHTTAPPSMPPPLPPQAAPEPPSPRPRRMQSLPAAAPVPPTERARFDMRGFLAGFALSGAIGAVLYLLMTVG